MEKIKYGKAICYSGYRDGQSPITRIYPNYEQVKEDLLILEKDFDYIRMYDPSQHAKTALMVIKKEKLALKVLLGIDLAGEISNPDCEWGGILTQDEIIKNIKHNETQLQELIKLADEYKDIIIAVSAGNEAVPEWNDNLVSKERVLYFVKKLKAHCVQPVTYCENNNYWITHLQDVVKELDFISLHTYPAWIQKPVSEALQQSIIDYTVIKDFYNDKQCIITEAGWPTQSSGRGIPSENASEESQRQYINEMKEWTEKNQILTFFFEAFDEPWKGNDVLEEPEKHWGIYDVNRLPKLVMKKEK